MLNKDSCGVPVVALSCMFSRVLRHSSSARHKSMPRAPVCISHYSDAVPLSIAKVNASCTSLSRTIFTGSLFTRNHIQNPSLYARAPLIVPHLLSDPHVHLSAPQIDCCKAVHHNRAVHGHQIIEFPPFRRLLAVAKLSRRS